MNFFVFISLSILSIKEKTGKCYGMAPQSTPASFKFCKYVRNLYLRSFFLCAVFVVVVVIDLSFKL